jgi:hypothetical protein
MHAPTTPTFSTRPSVPVWLWQSPKANPRSSRRDGRRRPEILKKLSWPTHNRQADHSRGRLRGHPAPACSVNVSTCTRVRDGFSIARPQPVGPYYPSGVRGSYFLPLRARGCGMASQPRARSQLGHTVHPESGEVTSFLYNISSEP